MEENKVLNQELCNEHKENIREFIESLKDKLNISQSLEEIATDWNGGRPVPPPPASLCISANTDRVGCINSMVDNSAPMEDFPWDDVLASMYAFPNSVVFSDKKCPCCGGETVQLVFESCSWSWENMCGISGTMVICPTCIKQIAFSMLCCN